MHETPTEVISPEQIKIIGIDPKKVEQVWAKLQKFIGNDWVLRHERHVFYCAKDANDSIEGHHFAIEVYPPNYNPRDIDATREPLADLVLVKVKGRRSLSVIQDVDTGITTPITAQEANVLLDQIATSTGEETGAIKPTKGIVTGIIDQTRKKLK